MKAYISISFRRRRSLNEQLQVILRSLSRFNIEPFVFVDTYKFTDGQEKEMMEQAFEDISQCDLLIAETSEKAIGIGVEVGYAKAKDKLIIYLRQTDAEHSTTVSGTSDFQVVYKNVIDLEEQLATVLESVATFKN